MPISDHYRGGSTERLIVQIITVDPPSGRIEGVGKDAAVIQIGNSRASTIYRWPVQGEYWSIIRDNGLWVLETLVPNPDDTNVATLNPGDALVQAKTIWTPDGKRLIKTGDTAGGVLSGSYPNPGFAIDMATQSELDVTSTRVTTLESWQNGSKGAGRWYAPGAGNTAGKGWTWVATSWPGDAAFFQLGTPPAGPPYATNSAIKILQAGVYRMNAQVLSQGVTSGRYDSSLVILDAAGAAVFNLDQRLGNYVSGGSGFISHELFAEFPLIVGQWIWPDNITAQTYGDSSGAFSHLTIRYMGT